MSIFGIMLFAFALTLTSCGDTAPEEVETEEGTTEEASATHSHEDGTEHSHEGDEEVHAHEEESAE